MDELLKFFKLSREFVSDVVKRLHGFEDTNLSL